MNNDWILCSTKQPEVYDKYLVTKETWIQGIYRHRYVDIEKFSALRWETNERVIAWMPLPEKYQGGK
jgi:hypothetical protein